MTSNHHAPYVLGYTRATMAVTKGSDLERGSGSQKSSADQHAAVNTFPGLVHTARHTMGVGSARSRYPNRKGGAVEGETNDWGEVVTR